MMEENLTIKKESSEIKKRDVQTRGGRNLLVLGVGAVLIALVSVGVALVVYHNSGDIYLDRSRPGFLPDKKEQEHNDEQEYKFSDETKIDKEALKKYAEEYEKVIKPLEEDTANFEQAPLEDQTIFGE